MSVRALVPEGRGGGRGIRETIHSGHFMVSDFEPESEAQDEEYEVGMPIPPGPPETVVLKAPEAPPVITHQLPTSVAVGRGGHLVKREGGQKGVVSPFQGNGGRRGDEEALGTAISIDGSLTKLFQCMSLAYRQKLTSPKWNRFKGVRLRWKDKIRLNNVIWRCWHMQFIMKKKTFVCQFASPLDVDGHNKPEAVVMEGKYWKRKLSTVAAEYKKWRLFYRNRIMGWAHATPATDLHPVSLDGFDWSRAGTFGPMSNIVFDDDMFMDFTDTLFSSLSSNQPFAFPNPREIARAGMVADFIQPGLIQLQPNLDDFMDTLEPLQDYVNSKLLPPVPEELENFETPDTLLPDPCKSNSTPQAQSQGQPFFEPLLLPQQLQSSSSAPSLNGKGGEGKGEADLFAKPQGKPRGRSRSGGRIGGQTSPLLNNVGSNTLLSHLLGGPGGQGGQGQGGGGQQSSSGNNGGQGHGLQGNNGIMGGLHSSYGIPHSHTHHMMPQSSSQGPSLFHAPAPNAPLALNFAEMSAKGNSSPPLLGGHQSPPMGPPLGLTASGSGPPSPSKGSRKGSLEGNGGNGGSDRGQYKEHRRVCHINAEQKRRCNIKNGFDTLHSLIPQLSQNPNAKVSKAAMLAKGAEYIRQLKLERAQLKDEIEAHRAEVDNLNQAISNCQSLLPATGAPVSRQRTSKMNEMFNSWVHSRTMENWKFWLFSTLIRPLLDSYNNTVSTASVDELCRTVLAWVDQHCSLVDLRPAVLTSLRQLCTSTDILSNPANLQEEAYRAVNRQLTQNDQRGPDGSR